MARNLTYIIASSDVLIDAMTNRLSILNVVHSLVTRGVPSKVPQLVISASWNLDKEPEGSDTNSEAKLRVISPGGKPVNEFNRPLGKYGPHEVAMFRVTNIPVLESGELVFEISVDDEMQGTYVVNIIVDENHGSENFASMPEA